MFCESIFDGPEEVAPLRSVLFLLMVKQIRFGLTPVLKTS
jgi:hypothetical protein